jgi:hypothetical protein
LEFLGSWLFGFEKPVFGVVFPWISLDFLGFARQNRELSMGYTGKPKKNFSSRFSLGVRSAETEGRR